jgi:hypothetical protein
MALAQKTILDRNGNPKVITVTIADEPTSELRESWRGVEFGWTADDIAPDDGGYSARRQAAADYAVGRGGTVIARQVDVGGEYVELIYNCGRNYTVFGDASVATVKAWAKQAGIRFYPARWHRFVMDDEGKFVFTALS